MQKFKQNGKNPGDHKSPRDTLRISNGKELFMGNFDKRSKKFRRVNDVYTDLITLVGGAKNATEPERQLAKQAACIATQMEQMGGDLIDGRPVDLNLYVKSANTFHRILETLGISPLHQSDNDNESETLEDYIEKAHPSDATNRRERI